MSVCFGFLRDRERETYGNIYEQIITCLCLFMCTCDRVHWTEIHKARDKDEHMCNRLRVCLSDCFGISEQKKHTKTCEIKSLRVCTCLGVHVCLYIRQKCTETKRQVNVNMKVCVDISMFFLFLSDRDVWKHV